MTKGRAEVDAEPRARVAVTGVAVDDRCECSEPHGALEIDRHPRSKRDRVPGANGQEGHLPPVVIGASNAAHRKLAVRKRGGDPPSRSTAPANVDWRAGVTGPRVARALTPRTYLKGAERLRRSDVESDEPARVSLRVKRRGERRQQEENREAAGAQRGYRPSRQLRTGSPAGARRAMWSAISRNRSALVIGCQPCPFMGRP